jgi:hypothetical protein
VENLKALRSTVGLGCGLNPGEGLSSVAKREESLISHFHLGGDDSFTVKI